MTKMPPCSLIFLDPDGGSAGPKFHSVLSPVGTQLFQFWQDEDGSSTVEMVVMMAASISMGLAMMNSVSTGIENLSNDISTFLSGYEITTSFDTVADENIIN